MKSHPTVAAIFRNVVKKRQSTKRFQPNREIPNPILKDVLESTIRSPSSFNIQPTQVVLVQSQEMKDLISKHATLGIQNQFRVKDCSTLAVFCSDMYPSSEGRIERIHQLEKEHYAASNSSNNSQQRHINYINTMPIMTNYFVGEGMIATQLKNLTTQVIQAMPSSEPRPAMPSHIEPILAWSYKNTSLVVQTYVLAATSYNLSTAIMEGFDAIRLKKLLRIPLGEKLNDTRYEIPMIVATGYDYFDTESDDEQQFVEELLTNNTTDMNDNADNPTNNKTPRLPLDEVVFSETFGQPWKT